MNRPPDTVVAWHLRALRRLSLQARRLRGGGRLSEMLRKRYTRNDVITTVGDFDGDLAFQVNLSDHIGSQIFWHGQYSRDVLQLAQRLLEPDDVVFDIGANIGEFATFAAKRLTRGALHAFEPIPRLAEACRANLERNGFDHAHVHEIGFSDEPARVPVYSPGRPGADGAVNNGMGSLFAGEGFGVAGMIDVVPMDAWCEQQRIERLDLLKMDVEGAELRVLQGGDRTIRSFRPVMIVEANPATCGRAGYDVAGLFARIASLGYAMHNIEPGGRTTACAGAASISRDILCIPDGHRWVGR